MGKRVALPFLILIDFAISCVGNVSQEQKTFFEIYFFDCEKVPFLKKQRFTRFNLNLFRLSTK